MANKTNADIYLRDGIEVTEFINALSNSKIAKEYLKYDRNIIMIVENFLCEVQRPALSDDEKVILSNIGDGFVKIGRSYAGVLYLQGSEPNDIVKLNQFKDYLFQFIKDGEEYDLKDLIE